MEVCIVGSGPSGLVCCKQCLEYGLTPVILTKDDNPGGLWNSYPDKVGPWDSMVTFTSKYIFCFSDLLFNSEVPDYPTKVDYFQYLQSYASKFNLTQYISYNSEVISVSRYEEDYKVVWKTNDMAHEKVFKYVILAVGWHHKEIQPFKNTHLYKGTLVRGATYRNPSVFTGKRVVTIGRSSTASDVACDALNIAAEVIQIYKKPYGIIEKYVNGYQSDLLFSKLPSFNTLDLFPSVESNRQFLEILISLFGNPSRFHPDWNIDLATLKGSVKFIISNANYLEAVAERRIQLIRGEVKDFYEDGVELQDGTRIEAEVVVLGLGYITDYDFLSQEIKDIIKYDPYENMPSILYRRLIHPTLPRIGFLGNYSVFTSGKFELPAEVCVKYLLGRLPLTEEEMWEGVRLEEKMKREVRDTIFVYNPIPYVCEMMRLLEIKIDHEFIRDELKFGNGPLLPQFFYLEKPGMKDLARKAVEEVKRRYPTMDFESTGSNRT